MSDEARVAEFGLKEMWKSPNGTIRNILNGNSQVLDAKKVYMYCGGLVVLLSSGCGIWRGGGFAFEENHLLLLLKT